MPLAYDDCVKHACCVDGLLIMLRHFLVPPLVRWQMLWRMRRRWLTWGLLGAALPPWTNNVAHPKVSWWGRLLGPLAMRRWAFSTQAWHCLKLEFVTPSSLNPCIFFIYLFSIFRLLIWAALKISQASEPQWQPRPLPGDPSASKLCCYRWAWT